MFCHPHILSIPMFCMYYSVAILCDYIVIQIMQLIAVNLYYHIYYQLYSDKTKHAKMILYIYINF